MRMCRTLPPVEAETGAPCFDPVELLYVPFEVKHNVYVGYISDDYPLPIGRLSMYVYCDDNLNCTENVSIDTEAKIIRVVIEKIWAEYVAKSVIYYDGSLKILEWRKKPNDPITICGDDGCATFYLPYQRLVQLLERVRSVLDEAIAEIERLERKLRQVSPRWGDSLEIEF